MSVIGIDFGNHSCYIAAAREGGIETLANEHSVRDTPTYVSFGEKLRYFGYEAKQQHVSNKNNTIPNFKTIIGQLASAMDSMRLPVRYEAGDQSNLSLVVDYMSETKKFTPTQIAAMLFTKLKHTAEAALRCKVVDVVIGVPCFADDSLRYELQAACTAAGLNVLRFINETTAAALAYGIYKQDLPAEEEKSRNVIFVDCGHSNMQAAAVSFKKGKLKVLSHAYNRGVGGRFFDDVLVDHFSQEYEKSSGYNMVNNVKSRIRLYNEVEKLKKQMSANSTVLPISIECIDGDRDFNSKMKRADFDELSQKLLAKVSETLKACLREANLSVDEIYSIEIVGGSTRVPSLKAEIEKLFKKAPSTTLNADEAVARGCALQCAILSPTFKVREFSITDAQVHPIKLVWQDDKGQLTGMEVFPRNHPVPFSKMLTFYRKDKFRLEAHYVNSENHTSSVIGSYTIEDVTPNSEGESQKVKVKVRVNLHGVFTISSATMSERIESVEEASPMEVDSAEQPNGVKEEQDQPMEDKTGAPAETEKQEEPEKKKKYKNKDLAINSAVCCPARDFIESITELECQMIQNDKLETERMNARNAVEEYVYEMRDKIHSTLEQYISEESREQFSKLLNDTENWLYEDGEDCIKQVYVDKLSTLKEHGDPVVNRRREREELPILVERFMSSLQQTRKIVTAYRNKDPNYEHLDKAGMDTVVTSLAEMEQLLDKELGAVSVCPLHKDPPVTCSQIRAKKDTFESTVHPIISKPKPAPPKVEEKTEPPPPASDQSAPSETKPSTGEDPSQEMDVD